MSPALPNRYVGTVPIDDHAAIGVSHLGLPKHYVHFMGLPLDLAECAGNGEGSSVREERVLAERSYTARAIQEQKG